MKTLHQTTIFPSTKLCLLMLCGSVALLPASGYTSTKHSPNRERVKMGEVLQIDPVNNRITIKTASSTIIGIYTESSLFYLGSGALAEASHIQVGQIVYLFGTLPSSTSSNMIVNKVVIRNASKFLRIEPKSNSLLDVSFWRIDIKRTVQVISTSTDQKSISFLKDGFRTLARER